MSHHLVFVPAILPDFQSSSLTYTEWKALKPPRQVTRNGRPLSRRYKLLGQAIQKGRKGRLYASDVDSTGIGTPESWQERGCPPTYSAAYKAGKPWVAKIAHEKYCVAQRLGILTKGIKS